MKISIIIPVHKDEENARKLILYLQRFCQNSEIIVILSSKTPVFKMNNVIIVPSRYSHRAKQLNEGAKKASGDILFFCHADSYPPKTLEKDVTTSESGTFKLRFDSKHIITRLVTYRSGVNYSGFIYGDRGLFMTRLLFTTLGGFREDILMEDNDAIKRVKKISHFTILSSTTKTSARRYKSIGYYRLQFTYFTLYTLNLLGFSQKKLKKIYYSLC